MKKCQSLVNTGEHGNYRPQRSCGQGNIFTPVCHSVHGRGVCQGEPPRQGNPPLPGRTPPARETHPLPGRHTPCQGDTLPDQTPRDQTPPGKQSAAYDQRAAGTHPTGMHSCILVISK